MVDAVSTTCKLCRPIKVKNPNSSEWRSVGVKGTETGEEQSIFIITHRAERCQESAKKKNETKKTACCFHGSVTLEQKVKGITGIKTNTDGTTVSLSRY